MLDPYVKIICLFICLLGYYVSSTPPNAAASSGELYRGDIIGRAGRAVSLLQKVRLDHLCTHPRSVEQRPAHD
jgi:hypothetical protein